MAKFEIEWSLEAKEDLIDILEFYFERNQSNSYSFKLHNEIQESIELLRMYPLLGLRTDYDNVRYLIKRNYQILYEIFKNRILIVMIWDARQNPKSRNLRPRIR